MGLRTPEEYRQSLRDGRLVYYRGQRVPDVTEHPVIKVAVEHVGIDYEMAHDPATRDLAVVADPETGKPISRFFALPRTGEDLLLRSRLIEESTRRGGTLVVLAKEIGTDALFALHLIAQEMDERLGTKYLERVRNYYRFCKDNDLAMAVAQTDVKGDRGLPPSEQEHPDYYVHVVGEDRDGITVRGAKVHTSISTNANEIIVLPTRNMTERDRDYAVAFAVPVATPGLKLVASPRGGGGKDPFGHPISSRHKMMETLTVFDDVNVPWDRVFLRGEWQFAGPLAKTFVEFHRFTAVSYKLPLVDLLVGCGRLIAEYNGIEKAAHVREKVTRLITYAETLRLLTRMAALDCRVGPLGIAVPNTLVTNMAKLHFASNYHQHVAIVQDLAGGLLVTGPSGEDLENPETKACIERFFGGKKGVTADKRLRLMNLIHDLTASDFGGYQEVLAIHAEGSLEAEKLTIFREHHSKPAMDYAKHLAGIPD